MENNFYQEEQLQEAALNFFNADILATNVWTKKYALKNEKNYLELTPQDTIKRITKEIHRIEEKYPNPLSYNEIYNTLKDFKYFTFGGSIIYGIGNPNIVSLANCFFIDNESDSYGGIFNLDESIAQLMKRRGGVGITIEHLRPSSVKVNNSASTSTGAVSFMERFSNTTREVAQDGRRGALMISLMCSHPDINEFINAKNDLFKITGANISVKITNEFMFAVENDQDYILSWPVENRSLEIKEQLPYNKLFKLNDNTYVKRVKAKEVWNNIVKQAHKNAEPGILFWDNIIKESPSDCYSSDGFTTMGVNPCAEIPLSAYDSCRLGSINIFSLVKKPFTSKARFEWNELARVARKAQRFMDDIIDLEEEKIDSIINKIKNDPEPLEIKQTEINLWEKVLAVLKKGRRTGIGILGLGDAMAALNMTYGTPHATKFAEEVHKYIAVNCYRESVKLAKERGSFPIWDVNKETGNPFIARVISNNFNNEEYEDYLKYGRRNISNLSDAPTGSISILSQTTSGIEPIFKVFYKRRRKINPNEEGAKVSFVDQSGDSWEEYNVIHYPFIKWFVNNSDEKYTFSEAHELLKNLKEEDLEELVKMSPWANSQSHDIDYMEKIKMLGAIQKWVDHSISSTTNLPEKISIEDVNNVYFRAWKEGCKGLTVYREGSRSGVLISKKEENEFKENHAPKRPKELDADYYVATAKGIKFAVIVGKYKNKPYEIFAFENPPLNKNTAGKIIKIRKGEYKFINGDFEISNLQLAAERIEERMLTLTASMLLRHGAPVNNVINVIKKIDENVTSFSSVVRRYLSKYVEEDLSRENCPVCGEKLVMQEGCEQCMNENCGFSKCS